MMDNSSFKLEMFIKSAVSDDRISRTQLSLYIALLNCWLEQNCEERFKITRELLMRQSKIPAISTYHRSLKNLISFGYIEYEPTFDHYKGSKVKLILNESLYRSKAIIPNNKGGLVRNFSNPSIGDQIT